MESIQIDRQIGRHTQLIEMTINLSRLNGFQRFIKKKKKTLKTPID